MRTNIVIDDAKIAEVMDFMGLKTKRETVDALLDEKLQIKRQRVMLKWRGKINWQGDLDEWRSE